MARLSSEAVTEAIRHLAAADLTTKSNSALEAFIVAKRLSALGRTLTVADTNEAVEEIFAVLPTHPQGRIRPFLSLDAGTKWGNRRDSGRKTVWNVGTRRGAAAGKLFVDGHMSKGLVPDAAAQLADLVSRRGGEVVKPSRDALAVFLLRDHEFESAPGREELEAVLAEKFGIDESELDLVTDGYTFGEKLPDGEAWSPDSLPDEVGPPVDGQGGGLPSTGGDRPELIVEERIRRMIRRAILSSKGVILVGPPGTGKTTILDEIAREICEDPSSYGLGTSDLLLPMWVTAEESWTARELVGGETVVDGSLRFRPGFVLGAIRDNRWLIIDELNRADMDKIFGPVFTWLSGDCEFGPPVSLGRLSPDPGAPAIELAWTESPDCSLEEADEFDSPNPVADRITFLAGSAWRLLGTYNAVDAQRVFRIGQALGRRFVRVPVPPIDVAGLRRVLEGRFPSLAESAREKIAQLYGAHLGSSRAILGPALFIRMAEYLLDAQDEENSNVWDEAPQTLIEALAEAYLINVGDWLARLEPEDLGELGEEMVSTGGPLSREQWEWLTSMLPNLG